MILRNQTGCVNHPILVSWEIKECYRIIFRILIEKLNMIIKCIQILYCILICVIGIIIAHSLLFLILVMFGDGGLKFNIKSFLEFSYGMLCLIGMFSPILVFMYF